MSNIQVLDRKQTLENMAGKPGIGTRDSISLDLWNGGQLATGFDIAQLFVKRCRMKYLQDPAADVAAWVVPAASIHANNWRKFRRWHQDDCYPILTQILDFSELKKTPFSGAKSCALLEQVSCEESDEKHMMVRLRKGADSVHAELRKEEVLTRVVVSPAREKKPRAASHYNGCFRNSATVFPHVLVICEKVESQMNHRVRITTKQPGARAQKPWKSLNSYHGELPARWIRKIVFSKDMFPYAIRSSLYRCIVPANEKGELQQDAVVQESFWRELDDIYQMYRGKGKSTPTSLLKCINYYNKLARQLEHPFRNDQSAVLYLGSGANMRACRVNLTGCVVDKSLYWWEANSANEAAFLVALFNAPALSTAFADSRNTDRDFDLQPLARVPIPKFNATDDCHQQIVALTHEAERCARDFLYMQAASKGYAITNERGGGVIAISNQIRKRLRINGINAQIDEIVRQLLPDQT